MAASPRAMPQERNRAARVPFLARSTCPVPRFCPTKVVAARARDCTGRSKNWSIFVQEVQPDMQSRPKTLI